METSKEKDLFIETLRGLAISLVVIGHVIGSASDGGMQVSDNSFMRYFYYTFIEFIQMPLFTVIAGWVYALYPIKPGNFLPFVKKKVYRIFIPMIVVGVSYFLLQYFIPGTNKKGNLSEIWKLLIFPYTLYWYLYSLFLVFIVIAIVDMKKLMNQISGWLIILIFSTVILLIRDHIIPVEYPNYLSYKGAIYLFPFFVLGIGLVRFRNIFQKRFFALIITFILIITCTIQQLAWFDIIDFPVTKNNLTGLLIGTTGTVLLFNLNWQSKWLVWLGAYSYSIFLFHAFSTAGGRIILKFAGINSVVLIFTISLACGLLLPVLAHKILNKSNWTSFFFLGLPFLKQVKPKIN
jgi:fucose 4-O-acetylase-like acetyltransferase